MDGALEFVLAADSPDELLSRVYGLGEYAGASVRAKEKNLLWLEGSAGIIDRERTSQVGTSSGCWNPVEFSRCAAGYWKHCSVIKMEQSRMTM